jgi:hypothetical protein
MKFQFGTKTMLLATATIAITCAGVLAYRPIWSPYFINLDLWTIFAWAAPLNVPLIFLGFVLGRKKLSAQMVVAFAIAEAAAIGILYLVLRHMSGQ